MGAIGENVKRLLKELPNGVELVAAAKDRTPGEVLEAVEAGVKIIGENYLQDALPAHQAIGGKVRWHFIGHLQQNKVKKAVQLFDMIETVDSLKIAEAIDRECKKIDKVMPVLIEVNSGREKQKFGVFPEEILPLIEKIKELNNIRIEGLMTMGPRFGEPEDSRAYFLQTKSIFDRIKELVAHGVEMKYLSMGMTNSYKVAIEEGANIVRIGSRIFGERDY
jgi:pyridoxal phosphate enzyme (YggS family)